MTAIDAAEFLQRCDALAADLADAAVKGEELRRIAPEAIDAIERADIVRAIVPTALGGHGLDLITMCDGVRRLAHGCPATAWTVSFFMQHTWLMSKLPSEGRHDLFGDGAIPWVAAPLAPTGSATATADGYVVSGTWDFATGVEHSKWVMVHAIEAGADFSTRFLVVPVSEATVEDVWFTSGMRATGSNRVCLDEVAVPIGRTVSGEALLAGGERLAGDAMAGVPLMAALALTASASAVGALEAAVESYRERLAGRVLAYTFGDRAAEQPAAQIRLAAAMSDTASARAGWEAAISELVDRARRDAVDDGIRAATRLAAAAAVRAARHIISDIGDGSGATVYQCDHRFQRLQRDVETLKGHVMFDWDRTAELAGRVALGSPLRPTDLA